MRRENIYKMLNAAGLIGMITVNYLAVSLPINGKTPGDISADYQTLFTPAGYTFSIWSLIYLGLTGFVVIQFFNFPKLPQNSVNLSVFRIGVLFFMSCLANIFWIFAWHYELFGLSLIFMGFLLTLLTDINIRLKNVKASRTSRMLVNIPFGLYLGWICVATIANFSVYFVSESWGGMGLPAVTWTALLIIVAGILAILLLGRAPSSATPLAIAWGLLGVYFKLETTTNNESLQVLIIALVTLILLSSGRHIYRFYRQSPTR